MIARWPFVMGCAWLVCGGGLGGCWLVGSLSELPTVNDAAVDSGIEAASDRGVPRDGRPHADRSADAHSSDGPPQDGSSDAGRDGEAGLADAGGASRCADSGLVFCDGFENGLDAFSVITMNGGSVEVDTTKPYRGKFSLHVSLPAVMTNDAGAYEALILHKQMPPPIPFYERLFVYFPAPPFPAPSTQLLSLDNPSPMPGGGVVAYVRDGPPPGELALLTYGVPDAGNAFSSTVMPTARWVCLEVGLDGGFATLWVDGAGTPLTMIDFSPSTMAAYLVTQIGIAYSKPAPTAPYEAWFDEVAADTSRIGCER